MAQTWRYQAKRRAGRAALCSEHQSRGGLAATLTDVPEVAGVSWGLRRRLRFFAVSLCPKFNSSLKDSVVIPTMPRETAGDPNGSPLLEPNPRFGGHAGHRPAWSNGLPMAMPSATLKMARGLRSETSPNQASPGRFTGGGIPHRVGGVHKKQPGFGRRPRPTEPGFPNKLLNLTEETKS